MTEKLARAAGVPSPATTTPTCCEPGRWREVMTRDRRDPARLRGTVATSTTRSGSAPAQRVSRSSTSDGSSSGSSSSADLLAPAGSGPPLIDVGHDRRGERGATRPVGRGLHRIVEEEVDHLPVVDADGHVVGMCTRTDILRARITQQDQELVSGLAHRRRTA